MAEKEFTYSDVSEHSSKDDIYMVVHDKVYDCSKFVDEHPYVCPPLPAERLALFYSRVSWFTANPARRSTTLSMICANTCLHSGGEEVMLDVGGQDATEAFEDVGHSDEAREILNGMLVGKLARKV